MRYVPQWDVEGVWKEAVSKLELAIARQTAFNAEGLKSMLLRGDMHLWINDSVAMTTQIQTFQLERVCVIVLCAGSDVATWKDEAWETIVRYAKSFGCRAITVYGRSGWSRIRQELKVVDTIMRYEL